MGATVGSGWGSGGGELGQWVVRDGGGVCEGAGDEAGGDWNDALWEAARETGGKGVCPGMVVIGLA